MSRNVSDDGRASLYASVTDEVWVELLTIDHADLAAPIRLTNNTEDLTSDGETFTACAFPPILPTDTDGELPSIELTLDNVDRQFTSALRAITTPITLTVDVVRASAPDTIESGPWIFESRSIRYDAASARIELTVESLQTEPFPRGIYTPTTNPGMFESVDR